MTRTDIAAELRIISGSGTVKVGHVCTFVGDRNRHRVKGKYLAGLENINGRYLVTDVAKRIKAFAERG
jgi:hypothetical protein